ncbi:hypothetical protein PDJAM_G00231370 [Pangasius djambal]|uniref:Uncharacterized protein n=1 Tax=Pangasius djambal TaxID=1691987 RepID=A0ACC5YEH9_9TELE|nr:hypothetical protein [Pangasius djambal]
MDGNRQSRSRHSSVRITIPCSNLKSDTEKQKRKKRKCAGNIGWGDADHKDCLLCKHNWSLSPEPRQTSMPVAPRNQLPSLTIRVKG